MAHPDPESGAAAPSFSLPNEIAPLCSLLDNLAEGVSLADHNGRTVVYANPAQQRALGYALDDLGGTPCSQHSAYTPEECERHLQNIAETLAAGLAWTGEWRYRGRNGETFVSRTCITRVQLGNLHYQLWLRQDGAEPQASRRTSAPEYHLLANALPQLVWIAGPHGRTLYLNDYWFEYTGASREEGIAAWWRVVPSEDVAAVDRAWRQAAAAKTAFDVEHRIRRHADGEWRWHFGRVRPVFGEDCEVVRWVGTAVDIHDRKISELELKKARRDLADILGSIAEAFIAVDREWRFVYVNARVANRLGFKTEDLIGRNMWEVVPASIDTLFYPNYHRVMQERVPLQWEMPYPPDRWYQVYAQPTETGMSAYVVDKTEQKRTAEALKQRAKLESIGLLAGGVAHDFNNLLVGILGAASLVQEMLGPERPEQELMRVIADSAERAGHLTRQMLAYAGKGAPEKQPLALNTVVQDTLRLLQTSMPPTVRVITDLAPDLPLVPADPGQIQQSVLNLLTNAIEAIPPVTGGTLAIRTALRHAPEPWRVGLETLEPGDFALLEVSDTGVGMSPDTRERVFDPFFTTKFTGRGLGLAAVQGIVRSHHGAIDLESAPGQGTLFRIWLSTREKLEPARRATATPARGVGCILVIDAEDAVRNTCQTVLEHYGYRVVTAPGGPQGLHLFRQNPAEFSVVLLDLALPDQSGFDVLQQLQSESQSVQLIVSSGYTQQEWQAEAARYPLARFLRKPYNMQDLLEVISASLYGAHHAE